MTCVSVFNTPSRFTTAILDLVQELIAPAEVRAIGCGLPAGSRLLPQQQLALAGTVCTVTLFTEAMLRAVEREKVDALLARHGTFPEVLDAVLWDAAIRVGVTMVQLEDLILYADTAENYWLVPSRPAPFVRLAADGLHLECEPPFVTWSERCDGVCRAAKRIIQVTRTGRVG